MLKPPTPFPFLERLSPAIHAHCWLIGSIRVVITCATQDNKYVWILGKNPIYRNQLRYILGDRGLRREKAEIKAFCTTKF
ncbi:hypothetical protein AMTR_s00077p00189220 [Amborella trichopoda]|uniref:Uncharacterized protein n=1 Tax=Amborella trichopoda TaxID=13333 RepID=W1P9N1_AMBTC|nr:hypothetical protein AMTR_s00077p00189220 [Amborella trichopoda]